MSLSGLMAGIDPLRSLPNGVMINLSVSVIQRGASMFLFIVAAAMVALQPSEASANPDSAVALAESRGLRIYRSYHIAAYAAAKGQAVLKDRVRETRGYVITPSANDQLLTFVGQSDDGKPYAIWRGRYNGAEVEGALVARESDAAILSDDERVAFKAERAALDYIFSNQQKLGPASCAGDVMPNVVVLPPTKADPTFAVYVMTPQIDEGVIPLGGHYRIALDENSHVTSFRAMTEGCHDIDLFHDGRRLEADYVSNRSDKYPNEIHVFASLATNARIMVDTGEKPLWKVDKGKIRKDDTPLTR